MTQHIEEALIGYVMRYGGMCRDCADMDGVCASGMPCDTDQRKAVVRHTLAALAYGIKHGFIANPFVDAAALAEAEERGRIEERERIGRREIHDAVSAKLVAVNEAAYGKKRGDWHHLTTNQIVDAVEEMLSATITKEPTP